MNDTRAYLDSIADLYLADEDTLIRRYTEMIAPRAAEKDSVTQRSINLINRIRVHPDFNSGLDAFMAEYGLDSSEGVRLMTLAEALARIPDEATKVSLIRSKLTGADWSRHLGKSLSPLVNSSTRALLFTSSILKSDDIPFLSAAVRRIGEPAIRMALQLAMGAFSEHFVLGETLDQAKKKIERENHKFQYSFDMLGEAAITAEDATKYFNSYQQAIVFTSKFPDSSVSIKLSALHPRYDANQAARVHGELYPALNELVGIAREHDVQITIDAEEASRLAPSLELFEKLVTEGNGKGFDKLGLAVQAYSRRAMPVLEYLNHLAETRGQRIHVRLVKGAYWDTEIKLAQTLGLDSFPVYTKKANTDISYLACAKYLIANRERLYPQFATHNVHTVACLLEWTEGHESMFEFQRLHGMGSVLYDCLLDEDPDIACCIYAPIGHQKELLPYLIRRLLENSANSSFVNQLAGDASAETLSQHPIDIAAKTPANIRAPGALYQDRPNSQGLDLRYSQHRQALLGELDHYRDKTWAFDGAAEVEAKVEVEVRDGPHAVHSPVDGRRVGQVAFATAADVDAAVSRGREAASHWREQDPLQRISRVRNLAALLEDNRGELLALMCAEAGKTVEDGLAEVREAVDFCRYYAREMEKVASPMQLPGPDGEQNLFYYEPRGLFACVSPWNFPVSIFTGQMIAALVTGNAVIAKPAAQTPLVAKFIEQLALRAGITENALQVLPGQGETAGAALVAHAGVDGVVFTGSVDTARAINSALAARPGPLVPFIAETGGQNVMIADSSALPEQVIKDVITSAFNACGQRCSALRVLYLQESCADTIISLLAGAMRQLIVGRPELLATDVGPVIDAEAQVALQAHEEELTRIGKFIARVPLPKGLGDGNWFAPCCYEIDSIGQLTTEHFGPILHIIRFDMSGLDTLIEEINGTGFGLTFGIHSRNETLVNRVVQRISAGNIYVNRNIIGAVVGTQPFGGRGLSGTGPKAGGPNYLRRFMIEKCRTDNLAAIGGAIDLIGQQS